MSFLEVRGLTKRFGGLVAINNLSFHMDKGEILGVIGPNGAGKTTLFNLITGTLKPDSGKIYFKGEDITNLKPYEVCKRGIARTHQTVKPFLRQTVLQNVLVGRLFGRGDRVSLDEAVRDVRPILEIFGLEGKEDRVVREMNVLERKKVAIARALATRPELLLLDEPAAGLNPIEMADFMNTIVELNSKMGISVAIIEHVMRVVMDVCKRVMVLHHGEKISEGLPAEVTSDLEVIRVYLGESL